MENSKSFTAEILDTNENGTGIARHEGMVVFVPGLLTGESAEITITDTEKNFSHGECIKRISNSPYRIDDPCPSAGICGGCTLGFTTYEFENSVKKNTVKAALRRAGLDYSTVADTVFAEPCYEYRNKIAVHYDPEQKAFGYRMEKSHEITDFRGCLLCSSSMNRVIEWTNAHIDMISELSPLELHIRNSLDNITVSLYSEKDEPEVFAAYKKAVLDAINDVSNVLLFSKNSLSHHRSYIHDRIFGLDMAFTSEAFRQVNTAAFEKLLSLVHDFASETDFSRCADLYCGSGIIGLSLAGRFPDSRFWGIEINENAIRDARYNAAQNGIDNIRFFSGDAASFRNRIKPGEYPELIVVDPPRAGLSKDMRRDLKQLSPDRIIYVSCNPQTMARDIAELCGSGYKLCSAVPVNMFPRTKHVETVVLLCR